MKIDANKIIEERLAASMGLDKYAWIMRHVRVVKVSTDLDFQRTFNGFYRVRRNADWREIYYEFFETAKKQMVTFEQILRLLFEKTGQIEASFSSKMLATLCPDRPIWDSLVLQNLGIKLTGKTQQEKLDNAVALYADIEKWYRDFLDTENAKECLSVFERTLPEYTWLSDVKQIDFFLWSIR